MPILFSQYMLLAQFNCTYFVETNQNVIDGQQFSPGDVICLYPGLRSFLLFNNLHGTEEQPITIVNNIGQVVIDTDHFYGVKFSNCSHIRFTGTGNNEIKYGVYIRRVGNGAGISIDDLSTDFELDHLRVSNTALGGIYAKTDPDCSFQATRDNFTFTNLRIHNCWLHDIQDEGFYIGSSKYTGQYLPDCDTTVLPHIMTGVHIHDNLVEHTGWDGIQVSSSPIDCQIYNNTIRYDSWRETHFQMSGILVGGGSNCDCYNNHIANGKGDGIDVFGSGEMQFYNNLIVNAGRSFQPSDPTQSKHGIFVGNAPDGSPVNIKILYNTIVSPKSTGIRFLNSNSSENLIVNNIIVDPGNFGQSGQQAFFNHELSAAQFTLSNNLFSDNLNTPRFLDATHNFDLQPNSPAVNTALDAGNYQVNFDILMRPRPHNGAFDIGAFESQDPYANLIETTRVGRKIDFNVHANPFRGLLFLQVIANEEMQIFIRLDRIDGGRLYQSPKQLIPRGESYSQIDIAHLTNGIYLCTIVTDNHTITKKIVLY
jgi:hypothetical protein